MMPEHRAAVEPLQGGSCWHPGLGSGLPWVAAWGAAAQAGGSRCSGKDVPAGCSVLRELWGASSGQFSGSFENSVVSDQFGQKPNVGRNHQKIPADQIPLAPLVLRGPSSPRTAGQCCGGTAGGKMHGRAWGPPDTASSIPRPHTLTRGW